MKPSRIAPTANDCTPAAAAPVAAAAPAVATATTTVATPEITPNPDALPALEYARKCWSYNSGAAVTRRQVRYSHYSKEFECNGICRWKDIDAEYAISFVFAGNFSRHQDKENMK